MADRDVEIEDEHIGHLVDMMATIWSKWKGLGLMLTLSTDKLEVIEKDQPDAQSKFTEMLVSCQRKGLTKNALRKALKSNTVGASEKLIKEVGRWNPSSEERIEMNDYTKTPQRMYDFSFIDCNKSNWRNLRLYMMKCARKHIKLIFLSGCLTVAAIVVFVYTAYLLTLGSPPIAEPLPITSQLYGREQDLSKIEQQLTDDSLSHTICTVTGPPGVGKSSVAIAIGYKLEMEMHVLYVKVDNFDTVEEIEREITSKFGYGKHQSLRDWVPHLSKKTLLILDNCDKLVSNHMQLEQLRDMFTRMIKNGMLKVITTHQPVVKWHVETDCTHQLEYLEQASMDYLLRKQFGALQVNPNPKQKQLILKVVEGMPLALKNIVEHIESSTSCDLSCILARLERTNPIKLLSPDELPFASHTVKSSIALACAPLTESHKKCAWHLAGYGSNSFYENKARTYINSQLPDTDFDNCIGALTKAQLLSYYGKTEVKQVEGSTCMVRNTRLLIQCKHINKVTQVYNFHPLIRNYILLVRHEKKQSVRSDSDTDKNTWTHLIDTATRRNYCPDFYMFIHCGTTWKDIHDQITDKMKNKYLPFDDRVHVGVLATYWKRTISLSYTKFADFIKLTLGKFSTEEGNPADFLAAFVFFNHESLGIQWTPTPGKETKLQQCYCPNPNDAHKEMVERKSYVEDLYSQISDDHLAWSARRSFYLDLYCCCRTLGECEDQWKYWIRGIVSQIAISRIYFSSNLKERCDISDIPEEVPKVIDGLWHYSFTKQTDKAVQYLEDYLKSNADDCPLLKIAAVMVLHDIYHEEKNEKRGREIVQQYLTTDSNLIDQQINDHQTLYEQVILSFLNAVGKRSVAKGIEHILSASNEKDGASPHKNRSFECRLLHDHHKMMFQQFVCLTL